MRKFILLLTLFVLASAAAWAQSTARVWGTVKDDGGAPAQSVTVSLLRAKDSALVKVAVTDKAGIYEFLNIREGKHLVSMSSVGFRKSFSKAFDLGAAEMELPLLTMSAAAGKMNNVTVTAQKPFVETKLDRTIVNVEASPSSAGASALEVLEKSPGVMVNNDGAISLRGKQGVIVMLDGKPTYLSPADLANLLKNMPASALEQIEIMTNPSAKYDASGNSGVINIKTKKGKNDGFNGSFMLGATTSIYNLDGTLYFMPRSQNSFNFNYRKNKINFFGNYNPNFLRGRNTMDFVSKQIDPDDGQLKGFTEQQTRFKFGNFNQTLKLGLDWYADKKNTFGVVVSGFLFNGFPTPVSENNLYDLNRQLRRRMISTTDNDISFKNFTGNLNWRHLFDSAGKELAVDFDYVLYDNRVATDLVTDVFDQNMQYLNSARLHGDIPSKISIYSLKGDYTKPIKNGRIEAGLKSSFVRNDNLVDYTFHDGSSWKKDEIRSNHFIYEENINAAYVNLNRQFNKWTLQGGLRMENTNAKGNQLTTKTGFKRDMTDFFPTAFVSYAASRKHTLTASYGRRITRPNYQDLNPFVFFLDTLSFREGNPNLKPQYTHNIELSHAFLGRFITTLSYNNTSDVISQIIKPKEGTGGQIRFLTPDNVARFRNMALSITAPIPVAKWNANLFLNVFNNHYTGKYDTIDINLQYTSFMVNVTNMFMIAKGVTGEWSGFYRYKNVDQLTRVEPLYQMSLAIQKQIMQGRGTLRLNVRDPFAWQKFEGLNQYGYVDMTFKNRPDVRQVTATFTLRFGKTTQQSQPRRRASSSQEEQNRVGGAGQ